MAEFASDITDSSDRDSTISPNIKNLTKRTKKATIKDNSLAL